MAEPKIKIDDLQPDWSSKGFKASWLENGVIAVADLLPLQDQPARGYVLEMYTTNESARPLGKRQQERANELIPKVKARMLDAMKQAGWSIVGRLENPPMDIWQHSSSLAPSSTREQNQTAPVKKDGLAKARRRLNQDIAAHKAEQGAATAPALQVEQNQVTPSAPVGQASRVLYVPAREKVSAYRRTITAQDVTYTCVGKPESPGCGHEVTKLLFPGATPLYCDDCALKVKREKTRTRVARLRAGKREAKNNM